MRLNPMASLSTTPRRLVATLLGLMMVGAVAEGNISTAYGKLGATSTNSSNTYAASSCFQPVAVTAGASGNSFAPSSVTIKAGCYVAWTQTSSTNHTTTNTLPSVGSIWDSNNIGQNNVYQRQFLTTGSFPYKCKNHAGMTGTITVN
ncbi:MAG: Copper binding protein plastocyanin/azurin family [Actinomycetota bacterium]|jgi:plastocyanin|nr:Copper binding protein plastocyanin/azurin family [Actinomycetota bacterium]